MYNSPESDSKGLDAVAHPSSTTFFFHAFSLRAIYTCVGLSDLHQNICFTLFIMRFHYVPVIHASDCLTRTKTCASALYNYHASSLLANYTCVRPSDLHQTYASTLILI